MDLVPEKKKRSVLQRIFRSLLFIVSALVFFAALAALLLFVYKDEVTAAILKELNRHLKTEVRVDPKNIDLTLLRSFPDCSLQFKDLTMLEPGTSKKRDTLLYTDFLNLHFSLMDLWQGKYIIKEISLSGADARIKISKKGERNFIFWEEAPVSSNSKTEFDLNKIIVKNSRVNYNDQRSGFETKLAIKSLSFSGHFKKNAFDLNSEADLFVNSIKKGSTYFLREKTVTYRVDLGVSGERYKIKDGELTINRLKIRSTGAFDFDNELTNLDLTFKAPSLDIQSLISLLPQREQDRIGDYRSQGTIYTEARLHYNSHEDYRLKVNFGLKNTTITYKATDVTADNVNLEGSLELTKNSSFLKLNNVTVSLGDDKLVGWLMIRNFNDPEIDLNCEANLQLEKWQKFWPIDTIQEIRGAVTLTTSVKGKLKDIRGQLLAQEVNVFLETNVTDFAVKFKHDTELFSVDNCHLIARDRFIMVDNLTLRRGSSDMTVNGRIPGLLNYLLDRTQLLTISGSLSSKNIRMEDFLSATPGTQSELTGNLIPAGVHFKLDASIKKFTFGKFAATDISGDLEIKDRKAIINEVALNSAGGTASISAFLDNSANRLSVMLQSRIRGIDITELFYEFNNFGQSSIEDKNLKGRATVTLDFSGVWDDKLVVDDKSIQANCNLLIERGELIDFKPLLHLSKFVDVSDLKRIRFSTLHSNIRIADRIVNIPRTSIKNSALNVDFWGSHDFDNQIDYHIQLLISELLPKKRKNKDSEFGEVAPDTDNKRSAFIRMTGNIENPKIRYDKQGMKEKINQDLKQEKQELRRLIREEFGLFKKDTSQDSRNTEPKTQFKLEEEEKPKPKKTLELKKKEEDDF